MRLDPTDMKVAGALPLMWGQLECSDGVRLRHMRMIPRATKVRSTLVLIHGRTEFIEKYQEVLEAAAARGVEVFSFDWRGQGLSTRALRDPDKGHVECFESYVSDLAHFVERVARPASQAGMTLMSHSMGGAVALHYLRRHCGVFRRALLVAPMVDIALGPARPLLGPMVAALCRAGQAETYAPGTGPYVRADHHFKGNDLTSDARRFEQAHELIAKAPELALGGPTCGWLSEAFKSTERLFSRGYPEAITTPTTFIVAGGDSVVDNAQTRRLAKRMVSAEVLSVGGAKHELLNEQDIFLNQFWAAFDARVGQG